MKAYKLMKNLKLIQLLIPLKGDQNFSFPLTIANQNSYLKIVFL